MERFVGKTALVAVLALAGCGWAEWPPPGYKSGQYAPRPVHQAEPGMRPQEDQLPAAAPIRGGGDVEVKRGDTVYALSRRYSVSLRAIIDANGLRPPYTLSVGQRLAVPAVREHRVRPGESLNSIAERYGLGVYELAHANRLRPPYRIFSGQTLVIAQGTAPQRGSSPSPSSSSSLSSSPSSSSEAVQATALPDPPEQVAAARPSVSSPTPAPAPTPKLETEQAKAYSPSYYNKIRGFMWPLRGEIISNFGPKTKGLHNDGINIAAPRGAPVRAAEGGVVAYAGNELRGFGNLLLLKHKNGWVTAYAHNDKLLVKRGDTVGKGQIIARVGSTGAVASPQLHFEIRRGKRAINPKKHLKVIPASL
ncbi:MAG: LysM peptidoglycan-binding domain-containing M23 family metallopeptidase [Rhodospirillales bacterium]